MIAGLSWVGSSDGTLPHLPRRPNPSEIVTTEATNLAGRMFGFVDKN
jgi:hypothetical protein